MKSPQFLEAIGQIQQLSDYINSTKTDKVEVANDYIGNISKLILESYISDSFVMYYQKDGVKHVEIWDDRDNAGYYLQFYPLMSQNIDWIGFQKHCKDILDFSRYKPSDNSHLVFYEE